MVTITNCNLEMYDVEDNEGGFIYHYQGFLEAADGTAVETCATTLLAFKTLRGEPSIMFLGRSPVKKLDIYLVKFSLQGDD